MTEELYRFVLREDMPLAFLLSDVIPEIPATLDYLLRFSGRTFTFKDFASETGKSYRSYLSERGLGNGVDIDVAMGITVFDKDDTVGVYVSGPRGECHFGRLEKVVQSEVL